MIKILILVEGQTEKDFVRDVLRPHFLNLGIDAKSPIIRTKTNPTCKDDYGGIVSYKQIVINLKRLFSDTSATAITSMIDFYGLPDDFPGISAIQEIDCYKKVKKIEQEFYNDISTPRFIPYLQLHEFEGLLFTSPLNIASFFDNEHFIEKQLSQITSEFDSPEHINDGKLTHPSKRIQQIIPDYRKKLDGVKIAKRIGLSKMRDKCPHFNEWISKLEKLANS